MLKDIVTVKPLAGYQLFLRFEDGSEGVVDMSHVTGHPIPDYANRTNHTQRR